jgi:predicted SnoaL-like aldol condensation-catalyzing enzyme
MSRTEQEKNKALVLEAFDTLFNKRDYVAAERYGSPDYIQHSAHIAPGRGDLFNLIKSLPTTLKYEPGTIVADGDFVMVNRRRGNSDQYGRCNFAQNLKHATSPTVTMSTMLSGLRIIIYSGLWLAQRRSPNDAQTSTRLVEERKTQSR